MREGDSILLLVGAGAVRGGVSAAVCAAASLLPPTAAPLLTSDLIGENARTTRPPPPCFSLGLLEEIDDVTTAGADPGPMF